MKHNVFIRHKNYIHIYNQTSTFVRVHLMTYISASAACMRQGGRRGGGGGLIKGSLAKVHVGPLIDQRRSTQPPPKRYWMATTQRH